MTQEQVKFKVDDWVYCTLVRGTTTLRQFKGSMNEWVNIYRITKWEPKKDEWCVFYSSNSTYTVAKFNGYIDNSNNITKPSYKEYDGVIMISKSIAPLEFIQQLKDM